MGLGAVTGMDIDPEGRPLVFFRGAYTTLT
jgi:hypothetical protein